MGATIRWRPSTATTLQTSLPSSFCDEMEKMWGSRSRWTLAYVDVPKLQGMAAVTRDPSNPYQQLIDILNVHPEGIEVEAV